jgi:hypothetical protein
MILSCFFSRKLLTCVVSLCGSPCGTEQLQSACSEQPQQVDTIRFLVEACPEAVKVPNGDGSLPLHFACANKAPLELIQYLVEKGGSHAVQTMNVNGHLPLHYACARAASLEVIEYLVDRWGEAVKSADLDGDLPLHIACEAKAPLKVIQFLVEQWPEAIKTANHNGSLPLHVACKNKTPLDVVEFLVDQWPEAATIMDSDGRAPLDCAKMPAADGGDPISEVVSLLDVIQITETKFKAEREEIRKAIALKRDEPVAVSQEYIEEILTNVQLGQGFFGVVWKGVDTVLNTAFAVKAIHQELVQHGHTADVQAARATFQRELAVRNTTEIRLLRINSKFSHPHRYLPPTTDSFKVQTPKHCILVRISLIRRASGTPVPHLRAG